MRKYDVLWKGEVIAEVHKKGNKSVYIPNERKIEEECKNGLPSSLITTKEKEVPNFISDRLKLNSKDHEVMTDYFSFQEREA